MIKVIRRDGESGDRLLKRFSGHVKSCGLPKKFRRLRYNEPKPTKRLVRASAVMREMHRAKAKSRAFLT